MFSKSAKMISSRNTLQLTETVMGCLRVSFVTNIGKRASACRLNSTAATSQKTSEEPIEEVNKRRITDYTKYISKKSSLREPSITRTLTKLTYKYGTNLISLGEGMPNESLFPFGEINVKLKDGTEINLRGQELANSLQYIPSQGLPKLVNILKEFQKRVHDPPDWAHRDLIVTSGSQDGIYKSIELLVNRGDPVIVPSPLYSGTDIIMKPYEPRLLEVKQDKFGMTPSSLLEVLHRCRQSSYTMPRVMYVNPTGNNPTGTVIPNSRRREIYDISCEYDLIILEDDPYHFLSFGEEEPRSFTSYDIEGRVLRFDSLSKVLSSGLRLGWVTGPTQLIHNIELHMQASYLHSSTLTQMIAAKLLEVWGPEGFEKHLREVQKFYKHKRSLLLGSLERHLTGLADWDAPQAGMFVWLRVRNVPDVYEMIVKKALSKGVTFAPGHAFSVSSNAPCPYLRASYSRASAEDMEEACIRLAQLIRDELKEIADFVPIQ